MGVFLLVHAFEVPFRLVVADELEVKIALDASQAWVGAELVWRKREDVFVEPLFAGFEHPFIGLELPFPHLQSDIDLGDVYYAQLVTYEFFEK